VATQVIPILLIKNQPSYNATEILNAGMAVFAGTAFTVLSIRLLPPLSPARRIQRLLALTLRDLQGMLSRRRRFARDVWVGRISRRLAVMPQEATLEEEAQLLAALSVGEAAITLLELRPDLSTGDTLDQALAELAEGDVAAAQESLARFSAEQSQGTPKGGRGMSGALQATLIADALLRHRRLFARVE
jgi:Fusaric acid resistance protein family